MLPKPFRRALPLYPLQHERLPKNFSHRTPLLETMLLHILTSYNRQMQTNRAYPIWITVQLAKCHSLFLCLLVKHIPKNNDMSYNKIRVNIKISVDDFEITSKYHSFNQNFVLLLTYILSFQDDVILRNMFSHQVFQSYRLVFMKSYS